LTVICRRFLTESLDRGKIEISLYETIIVTIQSYLSVNLCESSNLADMAFSISFFPVTETLLKPLK
jgi:hypothetical protein